MQALQKVGDYLISDDIYISNFTKCCHARRIKDNKKVIIKSTVSQLPEMNTIMSLKNEYHLLEKLKKHHVSGVLKTTKMINFENIWLLEFSDGKGESLENFLKKNRISIAQFFKYALQFTNIVVGLHQLNIIHKNINPKSIIIDPKTETIKLADLSLSAELREKSQEYTSPGMLEGTLAYISPEQTGRIHRVIDYRTDFYSIGVVFFQLLTGQLPFQSEDLLEMVASHISKTPPWASDFNAEIPSMLSEIINKLLSKNPEERYASAVGLKSDLERCQKEWEKNKKIKNFKLGCEDVYDHLNISQKLYGREKEIDILSKSFELIHQGSSRLMLITGYTGIGKTSIVKEIYRNISQKKGYVINGKFDQLEYATPYGAIIQAFHNLVQQVLTLAQDQLNEIRDELLSVLEEAGQVIINVIPEVEHIIGKQPPIIELNPVETQNRFNIIFQNFVSVFARKEHPLVLFLDDLQWAEPASLKFIELLLGDPNIKNLLVIGTAASVPIRLFLLS